MQICPACMKEPNTAAPTALSMSASASTSIGSLPPSSTQAFFSKPPAWAAMRRPTAVEPVKVIALTKGWAINSSPTSATDSREQVTTLSTPSGTPASASTSAKTSPPVTGVSSEGFSTTALPAAKAKAMPREDSSKGKFQGEMAATTPSGRRTAMLTLLWLEGRISPMG